MVLKYKCDKCGKKFRIKGLVYFKGEHLCSNCHSNKISMPNNNSHKTIEQALSKVYKIDYVVKIWKGKRYIKITPQINVPQILIGHKIKFVLADDTRL